MIKSSITYTKGNDWWLSRRDEDGREQYPDQIRVGSLEDPRVFVPERTCQMSVADNGAYRCSECGHLQDDTYRGDKGWYPPKYCAHCGARVVGE